MLRKCVGKFLDCGQPYWVLHMQIVLGHIHIRVTDDTLDGSKVNTQHLHLGNVGVPTAMGCQNPYPLDGFQSLFELIPEVRGIAGHARFLGRFPDILIGCIPKQSCTVADILRDWDIAVAVKGFGSPQSRRSLVHGHRLFNDDESTIFGDMSGFQSKQFLTPHAGSQHQTDI